jgi:hypothetical protein
MKDIKELIENHLEQMRQFPNAKAGYAPNIIYAVLKTNHNIDINTDPMFDDLQNYWLNATQIEIWESVLERLTNEIAKEKWSYHASGDKFKIISNTPTVERCVGYIECEDDVKKIVKLFNAPKIRISEEEQKLISDFMGEEFPIEISYDDIMPVITKIDNTRIISSSSTETPCLYSASLDGSDAIVFDGVLQKVVVDVNLDAPDWPQLAYHLAVKFINWYNQNKR